jgi:hypothetical protein
MSSSLARALADLKQKGVAMADAKKIKEEIRRDYARFITQKSSC